MTPSPTPSEGEAMLDAARSRYNGAAISASMREAFVEGARWQALRTAAQSSTKSAPDIHAPRNSSERLPSSDAAGSGADTRAAAQTSGVREAFRNADDLDWEHLDQMIGYSGHGRFWRAVFKEVRTALFPDTPREGEK